MNKLSCQEIRNKWIEFFTKKCEKTHTLVPSASLVPDNPTLLLNSAGMVQFVPIFMGTKPAPNPPRAITIQKCARVGGKDSDLENIGRTPRHHSFFEMLGNFSFGDYFKQEAIIWAWRFVTQELGMPPEKLYLSVFAGDETNAFDQQAFGIWMKVLEKDFPDAKEREARLWKLSRKDNFWGPPGKSGPCGPCSEIYYDLGEHVTNKDDRYVEIWNLVFMEFEKDEEGNYSPLALKNIDTGAGLERIATILQGVNNSFETNELFAILNHLSAELSKDTGKVISYGKGNKEHDLYLKIITDHLRCLSFLIADGVRPSNVGRGYVLRMIIRRAARFVYLLSGEANAFLYKLVDTVVDGYAAAYPELKHNAQVIADVCKKEEEQFTKTIANGLAILEGAFKDSKSKELSGEFAFDLYSTYGLPIELTREIAEEKGFTVDEEAYETAKAKHSEVSSTGAFDTSVFSNASISELLKTYGQTKFVGYDDLEASAKVLAILDLSGNKLESIDFSEGVVANVVLDQTTFYAESGGQVSDKGTLSSASSKLKVESLKKIEGIFLHKVSGSGSLKVGDEIKANVDPELRRLTRLHHTSCHLLQAALRKVIGNQVQQMGSQVGPEYTRFDFNFERAVSKDELKKVEDLMNSWIAMKLPATTKVMGFDEAVKAGALSFFEEKYDDEVRVLFVANDSEVASIELCGGTHVSNIGDIEKVIIASESSVASGIRRIKLLASKVADQFLKEKEEQEKLRVAQEAEQQKLKEAEKARKIELTKQVLAKTDDLMSKAEKINDVQILIVNINEYFSEGLDAEILKILSEVILDKFKAQGSKAFVFFASELDAKAVFVAASSSDLNASNAVKQAAQICGGGGGGRPNFAQAGGKDPSKIAEAIEAVKSGLKTVV